MAQSHLVSGLVTKYRSLSAELTHHATRAQELEGQVDTLAKAIKVVDPDFDLRTIRPKRFRQGPKSAAGKQTERHLFDALRTAESALTLGEIMVYIQKIIPEKLDSKQRGKLRNRVREGIKRNIDCGVIEEAGRGYQLAGGGASDSCIIVNEPVVTALE